MHWSKRQANSSIAQRTRSQECSTTKHLWLFLAATASTGAQAADWYTGAAPAKPDDSWIVAVDTSVSITSNSSQFAGVTGTMALTDNLRESGARARVEALAGAYDYKIKESGAHVRGSQIEGSALVGY